MLRSPPSGFWPPMEKLIVKIARSRIAAFPCLPLLLFCLLPINVWCAEQPKVRAVTAFVRLDRAQYQKQIEDALAVLRQARAAYAQAGYEVQTLRITTQPFPEYIRGLSHQQAIDLFRSLDRPAAQEGFSMAVGPAMLTDSDDPHMGDLLAEVLSVTTNLDGSLEIAAAVQKQTGWLYAGLDVSPAPLKEVSIGAAIKRLTGAKVGESGTLCGIGLDAIPLPGNTSTEQLAKIIGDVASLAIRLRKPLSARLLPVAGKAAGQRTEFDSPYLVNATIQALP